MKGASPCALLFACSVILNLPHRSPAARTLQKVTVVYRHGDRSPTEFFPIYPNKNLWLQGLGQLTKLGMQQQYELGQYIMKRHKGFLNARYDHNEVYVRSTDYDRTLMSAQANLAGMYPPSPDQTWNRNIAWQPIPVHTVPMAEDQLLGHAFENCPRYANLIKETISSGQFQNLIKPFSEFIQNIANVTGYTEKQLVNKGKLWKVYDALLCEEIHGHALPKWATTEVKGKLKELTQIIVLALFGITKQEEKLRLQVGLLLDTVLKDYANFNNPITTSSQQKITIYSAHETTIAALHMALGVSNKPLPLLPPYAACHFFELHKEDNGKFSIDMYYRNSSSREPYTLILPGCGTPCFLDTFTQLVSANIADEQKSKCEITDPKKGLIAGLITIGIVLMFSIIIIIGLVIYICRNKDHGNQSQAY